MWRRDGGVSGRHFRITLTSSSFTEHLRFTIRWLFSHPPAPGPLYPIDRWDYFASRCGLPWSLTNSSERMNFSVHHIRGYTPISSLLNVVYANFHSRSARWLQWFCKGFFPTEDSAPCIELPPISSTPALIISFLGFRFPPYRNSIGASHNEKQRRNCNAEYRGIADSWTREDLRVTYLLMERDSRSGRKEVASIHTMKRNALLLWRLLVGRLGMCSHNWILDGFRQKYTTFLRNIDLSISRYENAFYLTYLSEIDRWLKMKFTCFCSLKTKLMSI